ncbi:23S rRNA (adenine(1618)-N(6))-methyltransferase RlmF [Sphingobacterium sp. HJSM2_6]|uniref:23S rRNA (adenine(1618)-N(6))-methyltransferase RlmF n=1 Tax=Sphingobacterium sp. HJSM2_6 TaxID=3366264 RepID=UPI003BE53872
MEKKLKNLHPKNKFNQEYDFTRLVKKVPNLKHFLQSTPDKRVSIDFSNPEAVFYLNKALIEYGFDIKGWDILEQSLCPSIPGRLNYIHYLADLIGTKENKKIKILDIGTGSSLVYPILGTRSYPWSFVATEVHQASLIHAGKILSRNPGLDKVIQLREQENPKHILNGVILPGEYFDAIMCNPPFYKSKEDYLATVVKKNKKLHQTEDNFNANFQGLSNELWCTGGEKKFITQLISESIQLKDQIGICSSLVSNKENLKPLKAVLEYHNIKGITVTQMHQGNKINRILSWELNKV